MQEHSDALRSEFRKYVPNGTLREHLDAVHGSCLDFSQRLEISIDIAHGLTYLHSYAGNGCVAPFLPSINYCLKSRNNRQPPPPPDLQSSLVGFNLFSVLYTYGIPPTTLLSFPLDADPSVAFASFRLLNFADFVTDIVNIMVESGAIPAPVRHLQTPPSKATTVPRMYKNEVEKGSALLLDFLL
ncbi:hypothetical protein L1987_46846 [Smallanthus sonchifolius]|uniref:Uncharacterized protein n=1 Tax=Smallanthus sonchifolius TaxID=185202 RepID=A0ACB9G0R6_9ASTR|nr:hypothetical protein L1987_46846 [Smallanthus sonchifolius]